MNNKKIGTAFEKVVCEKLAQMGYWVHFIVPDARGAQPFDIIAVKNGKAYAIDCKTCASGRLTSGRLEENQKFAFDRWIKCGNEMPVIVAEYNGNAYCVRYDVLTKQKSVKIGGAKGEKEIDCGLLYHNIDVYFG